MDEQEKMTMSDFMNEMVTIKRYALKYAGDIGVEEKYQSRMNEIEAGIIEHLKEAGKQFAQMYLELKNESK